MTAHIHWNIKHDAYNMPGRPGTRVETESGYCLDGWKCFQGLTSLEPRGIVSYLVNGLCKVVPRFRRFIVPHFFFFQLSYQTFGLILVITRG